MDELYINGQKVDLGDSRIKVELKSNIFSELSKITSNRSYTLQLPHTMVNDTVFEYAGLPSFVSNKTRKYLSATYIKEGIKIIDDGFAVLLQSSKIGYEIALTWGVITGYKNMLDDGIKLCELPEREVELGDGSIGTDEYINLLVNPVSGNYGQGDYLYSEYNSGWLGDADNPRCYPCARVPYILNKIGGKYGLTFEIPQKQREFINQMLVPLTTSKRTINDIIPAQLGVYKFVNPRTGTVQWATTYLDDGNGLIGVGNNTSFEAKEDISMSGRLIASCDVAFTVTITKNQQDVASVSSFYINGKYRINYDLSLELEKGDMFMWKSTNYNVLFDMYYATIECDSTLHAGNKYYIVRNLPEMTCVDFIKEVMSRCGLFAINSNDVSRLVFISSEQIKANISQAKDWSDKLIEGTQDVTYTFGEFAQRNILKYLTDEYTEWEASGTIVVGNETIEASKEMFVSKFASSIGSNIPLYTVEDVTQENNVTVKKAKLNKLKPRIGLECNNGGRSKFTFNGMDYSSLIKEWYQDYQSIIESPNVVKLSVRLEPWDIKDIDYAIPVCFKQYGTYYAIIGISNSSEGIYEVELLKL